MSKKIKLEPTGSRIPDIDWVEVGEDSRPYAVTSQYARRQNPLLGHEDAGNYDCNPGKG